MIDYTINNRFQADNSVAGSIRKNPAKTQSLQENQVSPNTLKIKSSVADNTAKVMEERQKFAAQKSLNEKLKDEPQELDKTIKKLNDSLQKLQRNLEFSVDNDSGKIVINVKDKETDKTLRQIPSEEVLELARNLQDLNMHLPDVSEGEQIGHAAEGVFFKSSV